MTRYLLLLVFSALSLACASVPTGPAQLTTEAGEAQSFEALIGDADHTVLIWWSNQCPCVKRYAERVKTLADTYPLPFYYISSNAGEGRETFAAATWSPLPIFRDEGGRLAAALSVRSTPTAVIVNRAGDVLYRGWIDNEREPGAAGRQAWLEAALDRVMAGESFSEEKPAWGCMVTRSLSESGSCTSPE